jgi:hypothetical protein
VWVNRSRREHAEATIVARLHAERRAGHLHGGRGERHVRAAFDNLS